MKIHKYAQLIICATVLMAASRVIDHWNSQVPTPASNSVLMDDQGIPLVNEEKYNFASDSVYPESVLVQTSVSQGTSPGRFDVALAMNVTTGDTLVVYGSGPIEVSDEVGDVFKLKSGGYWVCGHSKGGFHYVSIKCPQEGSKIQPVEAEVNEYHFK